MKTTLLPLLLLTTFAAPLTAQEPPQPGAEHKQLAAAAGTWTAAIEMMGPDGKPAASTGKSVVKVGPGGLWVIDEFEGTMMGAPFTGHGVTGYDTVKRKYVGTWVDSWNTSVMSIEGSYDPATKALTMIGTSAGADGEPVVHKMVTTEKDANTRVFEMFMTGPDGKDMKAMTITYQRIVAPGGSK